MAYISKPHEAFCNFLMWEKNSHSNTWIFTMGNADKTQWHCTLWSGESMSDSHNYINMNTADTLCITHFYKAAIENEWTPQKSLTAEICLGVPFIFHHLSQIDVGLQQNKNEDVEFGNYSSVQQKCSHLSTGSVISEKGDEVEVHNRAFS